MPVKNLPADTVQGYAHLERNSYVFMKLITLLYVSICISVVTVCVWAYSFAYVWLCGRPLETIRSIKRTESGREHAHLSPTKDRQLKRSDFLWVLRDPWPYSSLERRYKKNTWDITTSGCRRPPPILK